VALKAGSTNFDAEWLVNYSKKKARRRFLAVIKTFLAESPVEVKVPGILFRPA
jgi:hypothetical protein